jgi:hypothetical protein
MSSCREREREVWERRLRSTTMEAVESESTVMDASNEGGSPVEEASQDDREIEPVDIQALTLRLLKSDDLDPSSDVDLSAYVGVPDFDTNGEILTAQEHQEMQDYFRSMMRAARPVASRLALDRDANRSTGSTDAQVGSPRIVRGDSSDAPLSPISPSGASESSLRHDGDNPNFSALENSTIHSGDIDEGELLETMTVLERQTLVRQLEVAERQNKVLQERLKEAKMFNVAYKKERDVANDRSAVAEERVREAELYLKESKIRQQELESLAAGAPALTTAQEEDLQVEELIKCKLELANFKDECDKLHQTNGNLERKLAQAKMELANAKEKQDDAEVQRDHALIMQQTALQELNLMRRQVVSGPETR